MNKCSFLIIAQDNYHLINNTVKVLSKIFSDLDYLVITNNDYQPDKPLNIFKTTKTKNKYADLVNLAFKKTNQDWNVILNAGSYIKYNFFKRLLNTNPKENDIIYPIKYNQYNFLDANFNGVLIHKNQFVKAGNFKSLIDFQESKTYWACSALENGANFKGILGLNTY